MTPTIFCKIEKKNPKISRSEAFHLRDSLDSLRKMKFNPREVRLLGEKPFLTNIVTLTSH